VSGMLAVRINAADHILGRVTAPVTLVEYGDYQCPACAAAYPVVHEVLEQNDDGLCFVFRHFPLSQVHPLAQMAAQVAEVADTMRKFWDMHDWLYVNQPTWTRAGAAGIALGARKLGITPTAMQRALENQSIAEHVRQDFMGGVRSGVNGTPSFFINGRLHPGGYDTLADAVALAFEAD